MRVKDGDRLVFIGDSITECMREHVAPPLGAGYVQFVNCFLAARHPTVQIEVINRGIDGETILDLERRWDRDVLAERPDRLFIMIGVNDVLYQASDRFRDRAVDPTTYEAAYRRLLQKTRSALSCPIVLLDPTPLEEDPHAPSHQLMRERADIVRRLSEEFATEHVPTFERLLDAIRAAPGRGWMIDVPHPNLAGHAVIAQAVLEHLEA